jgi:hypothetical protein
MLRPSSPCSPPSWACTRPPTYFGWRFDRGIRAAEADDHRRALRRLGPVERHGMSHYDPEVQARTALAASRVALGARC